MHHLHFAACLPGDVDIFGARFLQRQSHKFAASLDTGPIVEFVCHLPRSTSQHVIITPAKAGGPETSGKALQVWIPAFAGMTKKRSNSSFSLAGGISCRRGADGR